MKDIFGMCTRACMNRDTLKVTRVAFVLQYKGRCQQTGLHKIYVGKKKHLGTFAVYCILI